MIQSKIRFTPLDLPKFEGKESVLNAFTGDISFEFWEEEELTLRDRAIPFEKENAFTNESTKKYPKLLEYIKNYWPFEYYVYVKLFRANVDVKPHVDGNYVDYKGHNKDFNTITQKYLNHQLITEPCGYRLLINGNRKNLYMCNESDKEYCTIPEDTDCFALKTNDSRHGVDYIDNDNERLLLFAVGKLNVEKHNELIEKSVEKYDKLVL